MVKEGKCLYLKKLLYIGALSAILLTACEEEKPATEPIEVESPQAELKNEAIELDIIDVNENKVEVGTKVFSKGIVSRIVTEESLEFEFVLTTEGEEPGMYGIDDYALADTKYGAEITVYGTYEGIGSMGVPIISAIIVE